MKLEQHRTTTFNLEKEIEQNTKHLNNQELTISTLDSELKKLYTDIKNKSKQNDLENKQLEAAKKRNEVNLKIRLRNEYFF